MYILTLLLNTWESQGRVFAEQMTTTEIDMSLSVVDTPSRNGTSVAFPPSSNPIGITLWIFSSQTLKGRPYGKLSGLSMIFFFFFNYFIYLFIFGCVGSSFLCGGFL